MKLGKQPMVDWAGDEIRDIRPPETVIGAGSIIHMVRGGDTLDLLAYQYYGDESKWYLIADVNAILDVMAPLTPGDQLIIPRL